MDFKIRFEVFTGQIISSVARVSEENEKDYLIKSSLDSLFVASIGASLEEFAADITAVLELRIYNKL